MPDDDSLRAMAMCIPKKADASSCSPGTSAADERARGDRKKLLDFLCGPAVSEAAVALATLAWQRQWQSQELLGRLEAAEERDALQKEASALRQAIEDRDRQHDAAMMLCSEREQSLQVELREAQNDITATKACHAGAKDELVARLATLKRELEKAKQEKQSALRERRLVEADFGALTRELQASHSRESRLRGELGSQEARTHAAQEDLQSVQRELQGWKADHRMLSRVRELEGKCQRQQKEVKELKEALAQVEAEKQRLVVALKRESSNHHAAQKKSVLLHQELESACCLVQQAQQEAAATASRSSSLAGTPRRRNGRSVSPSPALTSRPWRQYAEERRLDFLHREDLKHGFQVRQQ